MAILNMKNHQGNKQEILSEPTKDEIVWNGPSRSYQLKIIQKMLEDKVQLVSLLQVDLPRMQRGTQNNTSSLGFDSY